MRKLLKSFGHAFRGIALAASERNFRIHLGALALVCLTGAKLGLARWEWAVVLLAAAMVLALEAMNTALERLADAVSLEFHPLVGAAKDAAAGAVLLASAGAVLVGGLVFGPHFLP